MSEKHYTVIDLKSHNNYRLTIFYNSFTIQFVLQSRDGKEKYSSSNLSASGFHQKDPVFKQYENTLKIADMLSSKIEKKQYSLDIPSLTIKPENVKFDLKPSNEKAISIEQNPEVTKSRISNLDRVAKEKEKELQTQKQNYPYRGSMANTSTAPKQPPQAFKRLSQPPKPLASSVSSQPPKPVNAPLQSSYKPPSSNVSSSTSTSYKPPSSTGYKPPTSNVSSSTTTAPRLPIVGTYTPPSMDKSGTLNQRIEKCKKLKTDMKKTLEDINNRLLDVKKRIDDFVDKAFANNPSPDDKKKALNLMTEVMLLRQGFKDIDNYPEIFQKEVKEKHITFNAEDKEKFDDDMILLGKAFPYALTPFHQKIDHLFIQVQHNFFIEKNLRFYKEREIADLIKTKEKLFGKS